MSATTSGARTLVRVRPAPASDPPYDDERRPDPWVPTMPQPPLPWAAPAGGTAPAGAHAAEDQARQRRTGAAGQAAGAHEEADLDHSTAEPDHATAHPSHATGASQAARTASVRFLHACLEIWNGYRPVRHVRACCTPMDAVAVQDAMEAAARRLARGVDRRHRRVALRRMRVCEPRCGVVEISAVVGAGPATSASDTSGGADRSWAAAFRLERHHGRWLCTFARLL